MGFVYDWFNEDEQREANAVLQKMRKKLHETGYTFSRFKKEYKQHFPDTDLDEDGLIGQFDNCAIAIYTCKGIESFTDWINNIKEEK